MTAATTITDSELVETLSLITTKMDKLRHRISADQQLTACEAADLAAAIEEVTADTYNLADRLGEAGRIAGGRAHVLADISAEAAAFIRKRPLRLAPRE